MPLTKAMKSLDPWDDDLPQGQVFRLLSGHSAKQWDSVMNGRNSGKAEVLGAEG